MERDFVSTNGSLPVVRAVDDWIRRGLFVLRSRSSYESQFDASVDYGMCYAHPDSRSVLTGRIFPSRDVAGRRFPLVIGVTYPDDGVDFSEVPVRTSLQTRELRSLAELLRSGEITLRDVDPARLAWTADGEQASTSLHTTTLGEFAEGLFGAAYHPRMHRVFRNAAEILRPLNGTVPPNFSLGLRFPLRPQSADLDASFWLRVMFTLIPPDRLSFFWTDRHGQNRPPFLLAYLREPGPGAFGHLYDPGDDGDTICDLSRMDFGGSSAAAYSLDDLLAAPDVTLDRFLQQLTADRVLHRTT